MYLFVHLIIYFSIYLFINLCNNFISAYIWTQLLNVIVCEYLYNSFLFIINWENELFAHLLACCWTSLLLCLLVSVSSENHFTVVKVLRSLKASKNIRYSLATLLGCVLHCSKAALSILCHHSRRFCLHMASRCPFVHSLSTLTCFCSCCAQLRAVWVL